MADMQLVKAPSGGSYANRWYPPMELLSLGTFLENFGYDIEIIDGQFLTAKEIIKKIRASVVGISFDFCSVEEMEQIAEAAKQKGCTVVLGGHHATPLARQILERNSNIDFVARFEGELALKGLVENIEGNSNFKEIPNIAFRKKGKVIFNSIRSLPMNQLPMPRRDLKGIVMENYLQAYKKSKKQFQLSFDYTRPTNAFLKKGCPIRASGKGCSYCTRNTIGVSQRTPIQAYNEFKYLVEEFNIDFISEFSDEFIFGPKDSWLIKLKELYEQKGPLEIGIEVYARIPDITETNVRNMKAVGVKAIVLGIESGNSKILSLNGKHYSPKTVVNACNLLGKYNIEILDSYIFGLIGETRKSVKDTINLSKKLEKVCDKKITFYHILTPLPGAPVWDKLMQHNEFRQKYGLEYELDIKKIQEFYINHFTNLGKDGFAYITNVRKKLLEESAIKL